MSKQTLWVIILFAVLFGLATYSRMSRESDQRSRLDDCLSDHPDWAIEYHSKRTDSDSKRAIVEACLGTTE